MSHPSTTVSNMKNTTYKTVHKTEPQRCQRCTFEFGGNPSHDMPCSTDCCMSIGHKHIPMGADILTTKGERLCIFHMTRNDEIESVGIKVHEIRDLINWNQV